MFESFSESTVRSLHTGWGFGERILVYVWTGLRRSSQSQSRVWSKCCATCWSVSWLQKTRRRTAPKNFMSSILSLLQSGLLEEPCSRTRWVSGHMRWLPSGCKNRERFLFSYHNSSLKLFLFLLFFPLSLKQLNIVSIYKKILKKQFERSFCMKTLLFFFKWGDCHLKLKWTLFPLRNTQTVWI